MGTRTALLLIAAASAAGASAQAPLNRPAAATVFPVASEPPVPVPQRPEDRLWAFSGNWKIAETTFGGPSSSRSEIPLKGEFKEKQAIYFKAIAAGEPPQGNNPRCIPNGPPSMYGTGMDIYARGKRLTVVTSNIHSYIDLDAKHTPEDQLFPTYTGESIAHFDGDVLVVDTVGLLPSNELFFGVGNSGKMHIVMRMKLLPNDRLEITQVVTDPDALERPWTTSRVFVRQPDAVPTDTPYCITSLDPTRDQKTGEQTFDLTPPEGGYVPPDETDASPPKK